MASNTPQSKLSNALLFELCSQTGEFRLGDFVVVNKGEVHVFCDKIIANNYATKQDSNPENPIAFYQYGIRK